MSLGYGIESGGCIKKDLKFKPMSKEECLKVLNSFGISWTEDTTIESLTAQYRQLVKQYHPDINKSQQYLERFNKLVIAINTLKKHMLNQLEK